ncbi:MAG: DUF374 domain-containing protein [Bacteroidota bacterium]|jgi:hypothetical protein
MIKSTDDISNIGIKYKIAVALLRFFAITWRYDIKGKVPSKPAIIAFWHGLMLPVWYFFSKEQPYGVVSLSKDGSMLSYLLSKWNFRLIRGSSSSGGREVLDDIIRKSAETLILMTPDGPQGPVHKFKAGAVVASQRSSTPLVLCNPKIKFKIVFGKSWDKFQLPLPFSKIELYFTEINSVAPTATRDEIDLIINDCENRLNID